MAQCGWHRFPDHGHRQQKESGRYHRPDGHCGGAQGVQLFLRALLRHRAGKGEGLPHAGGIPPVFGALLRQKRRAEASGLQDPLCAEGASVHAAQMGTGRADDPGILQSPSGSGLRRLSSGTERLHPRKRGRSGLPPYGERRRQRLEAVPVRA